MLLRSHLLISAHVALLAEGVDRNKFQGEPDVSVTLVALLAEGVDRNMRSMYPQTACVCRPPRGGRG